MVRIVRSDWLADSIRHLPALGVHQFYLKAVALQWIFAFTIMAFLFLFSLGVGIPGLFGKEISFRRHTIVDEEQERRPLLSE